MATAQTLPIHTQRLQNILRFPARVRETETIDLIVGMKRFLLMMRCLRHQWSWPRANKEERLHGFDAHQTCHKCTSKRFFDSKSWQAGPIYKKKQQEQTA